MKREKEREREGQYTI